MIRRVFFFLILLLSSHFATAQKLIVINDSTREFVFAGEFIEILEDKDGKWTIDDVSKGTQQDQFVLNKSDYRYNENIKSVYWIRFNVRNESKTSKRFLLESYSPHTNDWRLYSPSAEGYTVKKSGLDIYFYNREYVNKNLIFDFPLDTGKIETFYIRVSSSNFSSFDFRIKPLTDFFFYSVNEYYFLGFYYGIMVIMAIYNLLMFFSLREKVYIYYVLYVCAGILTTLADDGIGYQYVWINFPAINSYVGPHLAPFMLLVTFMLYSREFLRLNKSFPVYDKAIVGATLLFVVYYFLKISILPAFLHTHIFYLIPFVVIYVAAIRSFMKGYRSARFFIAGYTFVLISIVIIKLRSNGSIEGNLFTVYSLNYGLVLEVLVLSFALADRAKHDKKQKEKALRERNEAQYKVIRQLRINEELKDKVNRELEAKVAERTKELNVKNSELETANEKLKIMTEQANQMSVKLDIDNWQLQKKVQESLRARMAGQIVSIEEFNKIFPDENACFRYLFELKWDDSFTCYKCGNHEPAKDDKPFIKKCAHCGYAESVTAHTLFHALKFPITKAFLITYLMIHKEDRMTLDELSELLDLRRNTCWKFKQKVTEAMELYKKMHKINIVKSWENVIMVSPGDTSKKRSH